MADDEGMLESVSLYPAWKAAIEEWIQRGYTYGDAVWRTTIEELFGMTAIKDDARLTVKEFQSRQFEWLRQFDPFRKALLERCQMDLVSDNAGAYIIMPPAEQAPRAVKDLASQITREFEKAERRVRNVPLDRLSSDDRRKYMDSLAKIAEFEAMFRNRRSLPMDDEVA